MIGRVTAFSRRHWDLIFFFQAEDGIRDYKVTGVQTCALPISIEQRAGCVELVLPYPAKREGVRRNSLTPFVTILGGQPQAAFEQRPSAGWVPRSEERRVGKECRSRWSPYH